MNILKYYVRKALGLPVHYYFKRATVPAASHLPVLLAVGTILPIRRVLEFGSGSFSTLAFLDRGIFPDVEQVVSFETDGEWKDRVVEQANGDKRLDIRLIGSEVHQTAATCDFAGYDLVFVDNGPTGDERVATIKEVANRCHDSNLVMVHDFENLPYQQAASLFPHRFCFDSHCPHTGVLWKGERVDREIRSKLKHMNKEIARHARQVEPNELETWKRIIGNATSEARAPSRSPPR